MINQIIHAPPSSECLEAVIMCSAVRLPGDTYVVVRGLFFITFISAVNCRSETPAAVASARRHMCHVTASSR